MSKAIKTLAFLAWAVLTMLGIEGHVSRLQLDAALERCDRYQHEIHALKMPVEEQDREASALAQAYLRSHK